MLEHNELFREYLNTYGRQLNVVVEDHAGKTYSNNEVVSVTKTFKTDLCKSTMQQLNIEIEGDVSLDETVNVKLGVSLQGTDIEQINFGDFIITDREFVVVLNQPNLQLMTTCIKLMWIMIQTPLHFLVLYMNLLEIFAIC